MKVFLTSFAIAALLAGCSGKSETQAQAATTTKAPAPAVAAPAPSDSSRITGTALETIDAAGYTYVRLKTSTGEQWAAVTQASIKKGQEVAIDAQMTMQNFESKTLNRKFDSIIFGTVAGSESAAPADHMTSPPPPVNVSVPKAEGANATTIAEVWKNKGALKDKTVVIRGTVTKSLSGIMGSNWIHIQDGSGSAADGSNDLTITTNDIAAVGDVITVSGVVHVDKDFGAGYRYPVIVENATINK